jgi:chemotaxis methyl-accepting protein methylase
MMCAEQTTGLLDGPKIQIFATDIDEAAIAVAEMVFTLSMMPRRFARTVKKIFM